MLVLARKLDEAIRVGDEVRITILEIRAGRVRLGIEAPRHIRIRRDEVGADADDALLEIKIGAGGDKW
jgi:carbon storage regulator